MRELSFIEFELNCKFLNCNHKIIYIRIVFDLTV